MGRTGTLAEHVFQLADRWLFDSDAVMSSSRKVLARGNHLELVQQDRWEFASRPNVTGIVAIVAVTDDRKLLLIEQHRVPVGKHVIELPAGLAGDADEHRLEPLELAARRELLEETGYEASTWRKVAEGTPSAGLSDEIITLFHATGLKKTGSGEGDGSEQITLHEIPLADVADWLSQRVQQGCMVDLKVYSGLYFAMSARS